MKGTARFRCGDVAYDGKMRVIVGQQVTFVRPSYRIRRAADRKWGRGGTWVCDQMFLSRKPNHQILSPADIEIPAHLVADSSPADPVQPIADASDDVNDATT